MMIERVEEEPKGREMWLLQEENWAVERVASGKPSGRRETETGGVLASWLRRGWSWETEKRSEAEKTPKTARGMERRFLSHLPRHHPNHRKNEPKTKQTHKLTAPPKLSLFSPKTGLPLIILGQSLRSLAMIHAASSFSHVVARGPRKERGHVLVTTGVYA
jgi:hypothetical protein